MKNSDNFDLSYYLIKFYNFKQIFHKSLIIISELRLYESKFVFRIEKITLYDSKTIARELKLVGYIGNRVELSLEGER